MAEFYATRRLRREEVVSGKEAQCEENWHTLELRDLWSATADMDRLGAVASIHRGIEYSVRFGSMKRTSFPPYRALVSCEAYTGRTARQNLTYAQALCSSTLQAI